MVLIWRWYLQFLKNHRNRSEAQLFMSRTVICKDLPLANPKSQIGKLFSMSFWLYPQSEPLNSFMCQIYKFLGLRSPNDSIDAKQGSILNFTTGVKKPKNWSMTRFYYKILIRFTKIGNTIFDGMLTKERTFSLDDKLKFYYSNYNKEILLNDYMSFEEVSEEISKNITFPLVKFYNCAIAGQSQKAKSQTKMEDPCWLNM